MGIIGRMWKEHRKHSERTVPATINNELVVPTDSRVPVESFIAGYSIPVYPNADGTIDIRVADLPDNFSDLEGFSAVFDVIMTEGKYRLVFD